MNFDQLPTRDGFRLRGVQVSRLETFVDAAFAFAVTLLIISVGELPRSVDDLFLALKRIPTFGLSFLFLAIFWVGHNRWSRRYGLEDRTVVFLSLCFVFSTLVFVFPLRMVISGAVSFMTGGYLPSEMKLASSSELQDCFAIYGLGFVALNAILWLLSRHAMKHADDLQLNALERIETRRELASYLLMIGVGLVSMILSFLVRGTSWPPLASLPGFAYALIGIVQFPLQRHFHRLRVEAAAS